MLFKCKVSALKSIEFYIVVFLVSEVKGEHHCWFWEPNEN